MQRVLAKRDLEAGAALPSYDDHNHHRRNGIHNSNASNSNSNNSMIINNNKNAIDSHASDATKSFIILKKEADELERERFEDEAMRLAMERDAFAAERRRRSYKMCLIAVVVFLLGIVLPVLTMRHRRNNETFAPEDWVTPPVPYPNSLFANPHGVKWVSRGQVLREEVEFRGISGAGDNEFSKADNFTTISATPNADLSFAHVLDMNHEGTRLVVAHPNWKEQDHGYQHKHKNEASGKRSRVQIFDFHAQHNEWKLMAEITRADLPVLGRSVSMAPRGHRIAIGAANRVVTYHVYHDNYTDWIAEDNELDAENMGEGFITASDEQDENDHTGAGVALDHMGRIMAVGAPLEGDHAVHAGQVRVYQRGHVVKHDSDNKNGNDDQEEEETDLWKFQSQLEGRNANDQVGGTFVLSADGTTIADGSWIASTPEGGEESGVVRVWRYHVSQQTWLPMGQALPGPNPSSRFGSTLALSANGRVLAVPASYVGTRESGAIFVYVYDLDRKEWVPRGQTINFDVDPLTSIGVCLSFDGNLLVVATQKGAAVYQYENWAAKDGQDILENEHGSWLQAGSFFDGASDEHFGNDVACSADGHTVAMGSTRTHEKKGTLHVWTAIIPGTR